MSLTAEMLAETGRIPRKFTPRRSLQLISALPSLFWLFDVGGSEEATKKTQICLVRHQHRRSYWKIFRYLVKLFLSPQVFVAYVQIDFPPS